MAKVDVKVPDIGDFKDVPVIEVLVKPGDVVKVDQSLISLESDKATMDVPSPVEGVIAEVLAKVGDKVSMGALIARVESAEGETKAEAAPAKAALRRRRLPRPQRRPLRPLPSPPCKARQGGDDRHHNSGHRRLQGRAGYRDSGEGRRHGRGGAADRDARIRQGEHGSCQMPAAGKIAEIVVKVGDKVSMGSLIAKLDAGGPGCAGLVGAGR